jgi:hypothetical protein
MHIRAVVTAGSCKRFVVGFPFLLLWRELGSIHVRFVMDEVELGQAFFECLGLLCESFP